MSDYISREAAVKLLTSIALEVPDSKSRTVAKCINKIELMPAADVEPIVHGYWEPSEYRGFVRCSVCKDAYIDAEWLSSGKWGGCPNCRAKMDLEGEK